MRFVAPLFRLLLLLVLAGPAWPADGGKLVYFDQPESAKLFDEADVKGQFWTLVRYYDTQRIDTFCSVTSSTMVLNSLGVKPSIQQPMIYPFNLFNYENFFTPEVLKFQRVAQFAGDGATLAELADALKTFGVTVDKYHADALSADEFRRLAAYALGSTDHYVIVNFLRNALGQEKGGHFSPLAAYDAKSDRFLVLDTARYKYPPFWVKAQDLWEAMNTTDSDAKAKRGFLVIGRAKQ